MTVYLTPSNTLTPGSPIDDGGTGLTLGFMFQTTTAGVNATGVRWWATAAMTVEGQLYNDNGDILASTASTAVSSGWSTIPFTTPYAMTAATNYLVGVFQAATQKYTAVGPFSSVTNGPVTTVAAAGRYTYASTRTLSNSRGRPGEGASNNWFGVDIVADTGGTPTYDVTGSLPIVLGMTGTAVSVKPTAGSMPVVIGLTGAVVKRANATGSMPISIGMAGAAKAVVARTGTMPIQLGLTGSTGATTATGTLGLNIGLTGTATGVYATTGTMTLSLGLTGAAVELFTVTGTLPIGIGLAGDTIARYATTGTMPLELGLIGTATGGTERDITVTATLGQRRWDATLTNTPRTATLGQRRYGATLG